MTITVGIAVSLPAAGYTGGASPQGIVVGFLAVFFALLVLRLVLVSLKAARGSRGPLIMLTAIVLWGCGSATLNARDPTVPVMFPSASDALFAASYVFLVVYLLLGSRPSTGTRALVWLETLIICGGCLTACGFVLTSPWAEAFGTSGPALIIALLYPFLDVGLAILILGQACLRQRAVDRSTIGALVGFLVLLVADLALGVGLSSATYHSDLLTEALYGTAFALLAGSAASSTTTAAGRRISENSSRRDHLVIAAAAVAVLVLVVRPTSAARWYVVVPAVIVLLAAGIVLLLALREAKSGREARRLSLTDDLTGLPNRRAAFARMEHHLAEGRPQGLLLLGLDGFKEVNDSLGHSAGDTVLQQVAARLSGKETSPSLVARLSGDEFAIVVEGDDATALVAAAEDTLAALAKPVSVDGLDLTLRASVGVTTQWADDTRAADLLRRADVAMYEAKQTRAGVLLYDAAQDLYSRSRLELAEQLREGVTSGQLVVWYQPQVDGRTLRTIGMEALVRWRHPSLGIMSPIEFLPLARRAGLMPALTSYVIQQVVADAYRWYREGFDFRVSFNCAPPELLGPSLLPQLFSAIDAAGLPPERILVEVTEDSFVADPELAKEVLQQLRDRQVQTAIDDYGTGFSSLSYLRDLPVHELKIDRTFVSTMLADPRSLVIVDSTRKMAHAMGLRVVAEGVEDMATAEKLKSLNVDIFQGYHFARPMPIEEVEPWLLGRQDFPTLNKSIPSPTRASDEIALRD